MDIKKADRTALKSYFVKNAIPTEANFADLVDAVINQKEDGIAKLPGEPLSLQAEGADTSLKKVINFFRSFGDLKPAWTLSLNPRANPGVPGTARPGWSIGDADGNSRLFLDQATGHLGLGTVETGPYRLSVQGGVLISSAYLYVVAENAGRLRVGAAWGMPGLYSGDDGAKPLALGVPPGQKVYFGANTGDAYVEGGTGNANFKGTVTVGGNIGVGVPSPAEPLELRGRMKAANLSVGPWPSNAAYGFIGVNTLDQANMANYALLQGTTDGPGRTFLNSPLDIRLRIRNVDQMVLATDGNVGIGTSTPLGKLHVQTGGSGSWDRLVVNTTGHWGDKDAKYVTIGEGGASGIMFYNPHVVWYAPERRASIRMGRSEGRAEGHWWDVGVREKNGFSIVDGQNGVLGLSINELGTVTINVLQLGQKWRLSGVGDHEANDDWLRLKDKENRAYWGGFAAHKLFSTTGAVQGSDIRMKRDVSPLGDATAPILKLRAVQFRWADQDDSAPRTMGLVAQEVEEIFPEAVSLGPDGMMGINYPVLIAPLIDVVQRQQAQIDALRAEIRSHGRR